MDNKETFQEAVEHHPDTHPTDIFDAVIDPNIIISNLNKTESDLCAINNKSKQLDCIQRDLDDLMFKINTFIADSLEGSEQDFASGDVDDVEVASHISEKDDGLPEKELILQENNHPDNFYVSDGLNPPEINWDVVGPVIQKHIGDLQRLHNLNHMTKSVVKRIKNITQLSEAYMEETKKEVASASTESK